MKYLWSPKAEAFFYNQVGLWLDGKYRCNIVLANVKGVKKPWAERGRMPSSRFRRQTDGAKRHICASVCLWQTRTLPRPSSASEGGFEPIGSVMRCTDETPSLKILWQYGLRFRVEELFLDSKSGAFQLEGSRIRNCQALEHLYLVVALALLFATSQGMAVQLAGLRTQVDPHYQRGLSYLKIGLRWLKGVLNKGRDLLSPVPLFSQDTQPCFASFKAKKQYYDAIWFT